MLVVTMPIPYPILYPSMCWYFPEYKINKFYYFPRDHFHRSSLVLTFGIWTLFVQWWYILYLSKITQVWEFNTIGRWVVWDWRDRLGDQNSRWKVSYQNIFLMLLMHSNSVSLIFSSITFLPFDLFTNINSFHLLSRKQQFGLPPSIIVCLLSQF
jgi:hypothetical protein